MLWLSALQTASLIACVCLHVCSASPIGLMRRTRSRLHRRSSPALETLLDDLLLPAPRQPEDDQPQAAAVTDSLAFDEPDEWNVNFEIEASGYHRSLVLDCAVRSQRASATIHWLLNGQRIVQGGSDLSVLNEDVVHEVSTSVEGQVSVTKSRLHIDCLDARALGEYECVAQTPTERKSISRTVSASDDFLTLAELHPRHCEAPSPVRIYMFKSTHMDDQGGTAQLLCRASGSPQPEITWYYEGGLEPVLLATDDKYEILANGDLLIRNLAPGAEGDQGDYRCVAQNEFSSANVTTYLHPLLAETDSS